MSLSFPSFPRVLQFIRVGREITKKEDEFLKKAWRAAGCPFWLMKHGRFCFWRWERRRFVQTQVLTKRLKKLKFHPGCLSAPNTGEVRSGLIFWDSLQQRQLASYVTTFESGSSANSKMKRAPCLRCLPESFQNNIHFKTGQSPTKKQCTGWRSTTM